MKKLNAPKNFPEIINYFEYGFVINYLGEPIKNLDPSYF